MKHCNKCKRDLPLDGFSRSKSNADGLDAYCKECRCAAEKARQARKAGDPEWIKRRNERERARKLDRYHTDEKFRQKHLQYKVKRWKDDPAFRQSQRESARARNKVRYANDAAYRERCLEHSRRWANSERGRALTSLKKARRRSAIRNAPLADTLNAADWWFILDCQDDCCASCRRPFSESLPPARDHITPVVLGGRLTFENTQALCRSCNSSKCAKTTDFRNEHHRLWVGISTGAVETYCVEITHSDGKETRTLHPLRMNT